MGACVSTHRKSPAMKVHASSGSNPKPDNRLVIPPSPTKQKPPIINGDVSVKPPIIINGDFGSKEEMFFDSRAWLESDCEDDFMSVNGEFTPSRGNTPVHHNFRAGIDDQKLCIPDPTKKKKRLSELFKESLREKHDVEEENGRLGAVGVHGDELKPKKERLVECVVQGCLPSLLSSCRPLTPQQTERRRK